MLHVWRGMSIFCAVIFVSADHLIDASTPDEEEAEEDAGTPHAPPAASRTERAPYRRTTITMMIRRLPSWAGQKMTAQRFGSSVTPELWCGIPHYFIRSIFLTGPLKPILSLGLG
ncbi:TPA: hypothetical protein J1257_004983 [Escherichia coli]|nr:hypothetical protein [Escherichia coli]